MKIEIAANKKTSKRELFASAEAVPLQHHDSSLKVNSKAFKSIFNIFKTKPVIAAIRLEGVIGKVGMNAGLSLASLNPQLEQAFSLKGAKAVCLLINSPGGSPVQSALISSRIRQLAQKHQLPVYSFVEDMAASGGYWLACSGDEIYANQSSLIGNIGVASRGFGFHEAMKKLGIERRVYTQGVNKSILDPFQPEKESDLKIINAVQKDVHQHFIEAVKNSRKQKLTQDDEILFNGEFWSGQIALDYGLIDGLKDFHSLIEEKFGGDVRIEYIKQKESWLKKRLGLGSLTSNISNDIVDGIEQKLLNNFKL